nr:hypothetical protein [Tanacetum cinerariifolium]
LTTSEKGKQAAKASKAKSLSALSEVAMTEAQQQKLVTKRSLQQTHISQASGSGADERTGTLLGVPDEDEGNDKDDEEEGSDDEQASDKEEFIHPSLRTHAKKETTDEESFDPISKKPENTDDEGNGEENLVLNVGREEGQDEEDKAIQRRQHQSKKGLHEEAQKENDEFLKTINENMQKIIKDQVKEQVKTSYGIAADLSEMELKNILIEKIEGNKSIHRSNKQRNLYKALVEAYESNKIILDTYEDTVTL